MSGTSKTCTRCDHTGPLEDFCRDRNRNDGRSPHCRVCTTEYSTTSRLRRRATVDPVVLWAKSRCATLGYRARNAGIPFALTVSILGELASTHCPVFGVPLEYGYKGTGASTPNSPSVDRIVGGLGYVPGNVIVVSNRVNAIKQDADPMEISSVAYFYAKLLHDCAEETK